MSQDMISRVDDLWKELKIPVCMAAYVGDKYEEQDERILVIGERMDVADKITPEQFYENKNGLSTGQQHWFNYRSAVKLRKDILFRNIERSLKKAGYSMEDIAMFNFFQRPMLEHEDVDAGIDIEMGMKICHRAIELLRPTKVVIASNMVVGLLESSHTRFFHDEFRNFAGNFNFKYIGVSNPLSNYRDRERFENFIMHGQERFRLLSEQFQTAIDRRDLDELIRIAKDFQAEVVFMNNKRQGKCGKVKTEEEVEPAIRTAFKECGTILAEEAVSGREVTCGAYKFNGRICALPVTEIVTDREFFDFEAKYLGESQEICPARISETLTSKIQNLTESIYSYMGCRGIVRMDYIITEKEDIYFLEVNTVPGMTKMSLVPNMLRTAGIDIKDFITSLIEEAGR